MNLSILYLNTTLVNVKPNYDDDRVEVKIYLNTTLVNVKLMRKFL